MLPKIKLARFQRWYYEFIYKLPKPRLMPQRKIWLIKSASIGILIILFLLFFYFDADPLVRRFFY